MWRRAHVERERGLVGTQKTRAIIGWIVALAIVAVLMMSGVATAGYGGAQGGCAAHSQGNGAQHCGDAPTADLTVTDSTPVPDESIVLAGSGFPSNADVAISLDSGVVLLGQTQANSAGEFSTVLRIPVGTKPGRHEIVASAAGPDALTAFGVLSINVRHAH